MTSTLAGSAPLQQSQRSGQQGMVALSGCKSCAAKETYQLSDEEMEELKDLLKDVYKKTLVFRRPLMFYALNTIALPGARQKQAHPIKTLSAAMPGVLFTPETTPPFKKKLADAIKEASVTWEGKDGRQKTLRITKALVDIDLSSPMGYAGGSALAGPSPVATIYPLKVTIESK